MTAACAGAVGCSSADGPAPGANECLGTASAELKTCAAGATLRGIDVSYYQGNVDWAKVKAHGQSFAFARVSDGVDYPDTKFAQNWPAMKTAGLVRGVYQFFRPAKDVDAQVNLMFTKIAAAGGLVDGDLPPVLDLESDGGLPASTVVARAKSWIAKVEAKYGVKPIVYTAAFMSNVIGNNFSGYTLWVANYQTTCPTMPSGWTNWHFWQDSDKGQVNGVGSAVDTNHFNGTFAQLQALTVKPATGTPPSEPSDGTEAAIATDDESLILGDQGATIGSGNASASKEPASAPFNPCGG